MKTLKQIRNEKGFSLNKLARPAGVTPQAISRVEVGKSLLTPEMAKKLAPTLEMDWIALFLSHHVADLEENLRGLLLADHADLQVKYNIHQLREHDIEAVISQIERASEKVDPSDLESKLLFVQAHNELEEMAWREAKASHEILSQLDDPSTGLGVSDPFPYWRDVVEREISEPRHGE